MHGLIFETSVWLLAGSTRLLLSLNETWREQSQKGLLASTSFTSSANCACISTTQLTEFKSQSRLSQQVMNSLQMINQFDTIVRIQDTTQINNNSIKSHSIHDYISCLIDAIVFSVLSTNFTQRLNQVLIYSSRESCPSRDKQNWCRICHKLVHCEVYKI